MRDSIELVKFFHECFDQKNGEKPIIISKNESALRHSLLAEENDEYLEAVEANDLVGIADALGDQLYIVYGTILKHGLQDKIQDVFNEIHRSNMSKLGSNYRPIYREDGKILKGPNYFKPDIKTILDK